MLYGTNLFFFVSFDKKQMASSMRQSVLLIGQFSKVHSSDTIYANILKHDRVDGLNAFYIDLHFVQLKLSRWLQPIIVAIETLQDTTFRPISLSSLAKYDCYKLGRNNEMTILTLDEFCFRLIKIDGSRDYQSFIISSKTTGANVFHFSIFYFSVQFDVENSFNCM